MVNILIFMILSLYLSIQKIQNKIFSPITLNFTMNKATGKKISSNIAPSGSYPGNGGLFSIVNGVKSMKGFNSSEWCGWVAKDLALTIDLGNETEIHQLAINILDQKNSWIYPPNIQEISISNMEKNLNNNIQTLSYNLKDILNFDVSFCGGPVNICLYSTEEGRSNKLTQ